MSISIPRRTRRGRGRRGPSWSLVGSILALTAYNWLLRSTSVSVVATYAYVNPAIAVLLGWLVLSEAVTTTTMLGAAVVVAGVVLVVTAERRGRDMSTFALIHGAATAVGTGISSRPSCGPVVTTRWRPTCPSTTSATLDDYADVVIEAVGDAR